ncbi:GNAT family N-acetyltransferase [Aliiroseovarius sp. PrR006]|uniref:GNAT family N-acetyltransferase n=1 Tax=Aliiroseovarius sp. PrR006 TaxID=2706883 RepID=UPI0013CF5F83|nr:GNAT family N-acetyltransferase [Aliiroseovarius sp. PrR006]NDW53978.1 GNAT family N-acetyltransferase [Aliiroseovarius sp. PrR006]
MRISTRLASDESDYEQARDLCRQWLDWHWKNYPTDWPTEGNPMDPGRFAAILDDLPSLHARPSGGILLASLGDQPVGCVMYNEARAGVAKFNRMFVSENGRGYGVGRRLLEHMFEQMIQDGYQKVIFSSANFLTHAKAMYEATGFTDIPHPEHFPDQWRPYVYFMERTLVE